MLRGFVERRLEREGENAYAAIFDPALADYESALAWFKRRMRRSIAAAGLAYSDARSSGSLEEDRRALDKYLATIAFEDEMFARAERRLGHNLEKARKSAEEARQKIFDSPRNRILARVFIR